MPLGTEVGLDRLSDVVIDDDHTPPHGKGHSSPPPNTFRPMPIVTKRPDGSGHHLIVGTEVGLRPRPRRHCVRWGPSRHRPHCVKWVPSSPATEGLHSSPHTLAVYGRRVNRGLCLLWPNGWTCHGCHLVQR